MHSLLLTDKALYVMETRRHGGGGSTWKDRASTAEAGGDAGNGADELVSGGWFVAAVVVAVVAISLVRAPTVPYSQSLVRDDWRFIRTPWWR